MDGGEVAGTDDDIGVGGELGQPGCLLEVTVEVAEGEDAHGGTLAPGCFEQFEPDLAA